MKLVLDCYLTAIQNKNYKFLSINQDIIDDWALIQNDTNRKSIVSHKSVVFSISQLFKRTTADYNLISFDNIILWYRNVLTDNEKHYKAGHNFNIFNLLKDKFGFSIQETMHSKLLQFLLDTNETHGQGGKFLLEFLKMLNVESPEKGVWDVTAEIGRIDILITRKLPHSIIIIENKSNWAIDQKNQLYKYWYNAIFLKTKEYSTSFYERNVNNYKILYLVPNTHKELEYQSISKPKELPYSSYHDLPDIVPIQITIVSFDEHIQRWLTNCLSVLPADNHRIREYIIQYQHLCNNL
ncbi:PD-(D/E)XK nuclease family protein [Rufibacter sediminis]|uniref:PD-(D/E)XK nuclease family protein n=1 Tax=Rufibacter sediminis TaxID=2762756 RepID=A0ABR6VTJ5_9BACT|nr:PD-(D/E)XK nuclease family protein [Rufibacter sediminis]MBC3540249.1 PD-(D/E)XK nuclease family protein [Rufibacter sediminis]